MDTKITTSGEKLKEIRKKYKIKQYELSGTDLTRNMISMIETDKAGLTKSTAEILIKNIYKICSEKSIDCDITLEYLLESAEYQAKNIYNEFIELLKSSPEKIFQNETQENLNEIQKLLDKYKLKQEKVTLYLMLSEVFNNFRDFTRAYAYAIRAFENYINPFNDLKFIDLIINITYYCNYLKKYKETLNFSSLAYTYMNNIPKDLEYKLKFNNIIAHKNLKDYESALKHITEFEDNFGDNLDFDPSKKINVMILKANCLNEKFYYNDALQIHKKLLTLTENNIEMYIVTLCNIIEIYIKMNDSKNLKECIHKCILSLDKYEQLDSKKFSSEIYNDIGLGSYFINNLAMSKVYFNKALIESKKHKKIDVIVSSMEKLLNIAINNNSSNEVNNLKNQLIEIISLGLLPVNNIIILKLIKYYNNLGDVETINDIVNFSESMFSKSEAR